jgi:hypothetical protein
MAIDAADIPLSHRGMTLRDYFAAQTLGAIVEVCLKKNVPSTEQMAASAYEIADALLAERRKVAS